MNQIGEIYFSPTNLYDSKWLESTTFSSRVIYIFFCGKVNLMKYLGVWLISEGACILCGLGFEGYVGGTPRWRAMKNMDVWKFETCTNFSGLTVAFNINTNAWVKAYIFKRLIFLNNKEFSLFAALSFLAIWHGFSIGYFVTFYSEFLYFKAESVVSQLHAPLVKALEPHPSAYKIYDFICWLVRNLGLSYALVPFYLKTGERFLPILNSVFWFGHVVVVVLCLISFLLPRKPKSKEVQKES